MFCNIKNKTDTLKECAPVTFFLWRKGGGEGGAQGAGGGVRILYWYSSWYYIPSEILRWIYCVVLYFWWPFLQITHINITQLLRSYFAKKAVLKSFAKFTRKDLCRSIFLNKVASRIAFSSLHKRWSLPSRIFSGNLTKSAVFI